ncbi:MAG: hypothetical protein IJG51_09975 [Synergistaceae bacterium]|nr:hypothetical protein [Synergistaceae bacterium]MBQ3399205.1 hypothetical protein [Synergistaceae bacterium]MBQ6114880.1 hypothetical protein [Synergistaceae bacterium]MBQ6417189.1 hypothetical protein [Synergistaceae bacterium]MBQ6665481.1 hypothetical protein [Synergistaceae bacterium]
MSTNTENTYESVSKETFDAHIQRVDQRFESQEKLFVEKLDKMQTVFDERLDKMQTVLNERLDKMQAVFERSQAQFERTIEKSVAELSGEVKAMNARLDTMQQQYSWKIGWLGTVFTFCGAALAVYPLLSQYLTPQWIMATFGVGGLGILLLSLRHK